MIATSQSWNHQPFTEGVALPLEAVFDQTHFERITRGIVPVEMEDKWFAFYEPPYLYLHRSWTGLPIYRVRFAVRNHSARTAEVLWSAQNVTVAPDADLAGEAERLHTLLQKLPFGSSPVTESTSYAD